MFLFRFYCACTRPRRYRRRNALAASADVSLAANLPSAFLSPARSLLNPTPNSHTRTPSPSALARYSGNAGLNASACVAPKPPPPSRRAAVRGFRRSKRRQRLRRVPRAATRQVVQHDVAVGGADREQQRPVRRPVEPEERALRRP